MIFKVHSVLSGEEIAGEGMEARHLLEVTGAVQAEFMIAGTQVVRMKVVRCSLIPNIFLLTIIIVNIY